MEDKQMKKFLISSIIAAMAISPFIGFKKTNKEEITFEINSNEVGQKLEDKGNLGKRAGVYNGQFDIPGLGGGTGNNNGGNGGSDGNGDDDNGGNSGGWTIPDGTDLGETVIDPLIGQIGNGSNDDNGEGDDDGDNSGEWFKPDDITIGIHDDDPINTQIGGGDNSGETIGGGFTLGPITEGPGASETSTLTTYYDSGNDDDYNGHTYFAPVRVGESGVLVGTLRNKYDQYFEDWFLFTVDVRSSITIDFTQRPNNLYLFEIYKFGSFPTFYYSLNDDGSSTACIDAEVGSYYIKVFCKYPARATKDQYSITYVSSFVEKETSIDWLDEDTKMLVWESDSIPTNIDHWNGSHNLFYIGDEAEMCGYPDHVPDFGYLDPLYRRANDSVDTDAIFLDSVMFMWDRNDLYEYGLFLNNLIDSLITAIGESTNSSFKVDSWKIVLDGAVATLSLVFSVCSSTFTFYASIGLSLYGFVSYLVGGLPKSTVNAYEAGLLINHLTELKNNCFNARENQAVAIPRHAKLQKDGAYGVYWKTGFFPQNTASTPDGVGYYIVEKDEIISSIRNPKYNFRAESGTFSEYFDFDDFVSQTGYSDPSVEQMIPIH